MLKVQAFPPSQKVVTKEDLVNYYEMQIVMLPGVKLDKTVRNDQMVLVVTSFLSDLAAIKFGINEEDLMKNMALMQSPEVLKKTQEFQMALMRLTGGAKPFM